MEEAGGIATRIPEPRNTLATLRKQVPRGLWCVRRHRKRRGSFPARHTWEDKPRLLVGARSKTDGTGTGHHESTRQHHLLPVSTDHSRVTTASHLWSASVPRRLTSERVSSPRVWRRCASHWSLRLSSP